MKTIRPLVYVVIALGVSLSAQAATNTGNDLITVYNPAIAGRLADRLSLSPRLDTLDGKTLPKAINIVVVGGNIQTTWFVTDFMVRRGVLVDVWR